MESCCASSSYFQLQTVPPPVSVFSDGIQVKQRRLPVISYKISSNGCKIQPLISISLEMSTALYRKSNE